MVTARHGEITGSAARSACREFPSGVFHSKSLPDDARRGVRDRSSPWRRHAHLVGDALDARDARQQALQVRFAQ